ncbi:MAG: FKBP-type peptidyl-prolyl cis-trans isomerase [Clostridia bacterium]|nr:FKBP-type peptidyl-prolyl cis-trans isomerase [Clostridia bacterium]
MKKSTIITVVAFALGLAVLTLGFILLTDNNISNKFFAPKDTTTTTTTTGKPNSGEPLPEYDPMKFFDLDMTQYVTLGQYKDLVIEADKIEYSDEEIDFEIYKVMCVAGDLTKVYEGKVTEKVVFNFDYTGYLTKEDGTLGEKFNGGAATNQLAYINGNNFVTLSSNGEGGFIDGFAQGMINASVGETFKIDITFPSDYHAPEMAGKKTVFEVKVNFIAQAEPSDGWVKQYSKDKFKTVEEYKKSVKDELEKEIKSANVNLLWKQIIENATVTSVPQEQLDILYNQFVAEVESYVLYSEYYFGTKLDFNGVLTKLGFKNTDELRDYAKEVIEGDLIYYAVIQAENLTASDEEYRTLLDTIIEQTGKTEEDVLKTYSEDYIRKQIVLNKLDDHVYDLNTFVLKTEE